MSSKSNLYLVARPFTRVAITLKQINKLSASRKPEIRVTFAIRDNRSKMCIKIHEKILSAASELFSATEVGRFCKACKNQETCLYILIS